GVPLLRRRPLRDGAGDAAHGAAPEPRAAAQRRAGPPPPRRRRPPPRRPRDPGRPAGRRRRGVSARVSSGRLVPPAPPMPRRYALLALAVVLTAPLRAQERPPLTVDQITQA